MTKADGIAHGTLGAYTYYKCRCDECRTAVREYGRQWRVANIEKAREAGRRYITANRDVMKARTAAWRVANPEASRAQAKAWREANPERAHAASIAWNRAHPEVMRAVGARQRAKPEVRERARRQTAAWRLANPERVRLNGRRWQQANPDKVLLNIQRRRARKAKAGIYQITERDWRRLVARFDHRCAYCGEARPLTQEHVIPLARGGRHAIGNLLPVCSPCNSSKNQKLLIEWRAISKVGDDRWRMSSTSPSTMSPPNSGRPTPPGMG
jgi:5-methylcytosine-specific restriction endonuclease McrA